jgi:hypothetical protein
VKRIPTYHRLYLFLQIAEKAVTPLGHSSEGHQAMQHTARLAESRGTQGYSPRDPSVDGLNRQQFHKSTSSLGATGHWIHLASVMAPLVIGEVVKDAEKRWRAIRLVSVGTALLTEAAWTYRLSQKHKEQEACERDCKR